jgi:hypothetical protein
LVNFSEKWEYCDGIFPFVFVFCILAKVHKKKKLITPGVFFFPILWGRWSSNHPQKDFAKFGYKLERKVEKFRKSCYILANTYLYSKSEIDFPFNIKITIIYLLIPFCLNLAISNFIFSGNVITLAQFWLFCRLLQNLGFRVIICRSSPSILCLQFTR